MEARKTRRRVETGIGTGNSVIFFVKIYKAI